MSAWWRQYSAIRIAAGFAWRFLLARLLSVSALMLAAYFYHPHDFAVFGFYLAALNIVAIVQFLRFDGAIASIARDKMLQPVLHMCVWVGCLTTLLITLALLIGFELQLVGALIAFCFVVALIGRGVVRLSTLIATRDGDFSFLGRIMVLQSIIQPFALFCFMTSSLEGFLVLLLADMIGVWCAVGLCLWRLRAHSDLFAGIWRNLGMIRSQMTIWRAMPLLNLPSALLAVVFSSLPLLVTSYMALPTLAGAVALAMRILDMPTQLIGAAATPLMLNRLNERKISLVSKFRVVLSFYALGIFILFGLISAFIYILTPLLTGTKWEGMLLVMPILTLFYAGLSIAGPLIEVESTFHRQKTFLIIQFTACFSALIAAFIFQEQLMFFLIAVGGISIARGLLIMIDVMHLYRLSATADVDGQMSEFK